ncbi:hypothetical protein THAOC_20639 [Thalassiosira oceanica]|uniref:Uncharacterized protein n=1 Tax=Thalassiosira oceanica TaxID=159749 RepID=K0SL52_THAOC|nr:hypothetical protein THAOC_20639 [Thalassiosira oceanica]|eukprot:EJK59172.1 hypothetical protein THAOC_20639 [Thalassiosira oceanica]
MQIRTVPRQSSRSTKATQDRVLNLPAEPPYTTPTAGASVNWEPPAHKSETYARKEAEVNNMSKVQVFALLLAVASCATTITTVVIFGMELRSLKANERQDINSVSNHLMSVETQQQQTQQHVQTLTKIVSQTLNATDEYINNITSTVTEAKQTISEDINAVQDIKDNQNTLFAVQFAGPQVQRKICAIIWMTPLYSLSSWLSLVFETAEPYLQIVREFYESYCIYIFLSFLISVLGRGDRNAVVDLLEQKADELRPPDKCRCGPKAWRRWHNSCLDKCGKRRRLSNDNELPMTETKSPSPGRRGGRELPLAVHSPQSPPSPHFPEPPDYHNNLENSPARMKAEAVLDQCQFYAMQFVFLRPLTAIGWAISNRFVQPQHFLDYRTPQVYITTVANLSIFFAFRGLVSFYHATGSYLHQNFLICLEMLFSAVAHVFVFSPDEWAPGYREREEERKRTTSHHAFGDSVALGDFIDDVKVVLASKKRRRKRKNTLSPNSSVSGDDDATIESNENEDVSIHTPEEDRTNGFSDMSNFTIDEHKEGILPPTPVRSGTRPRLGTDDSHPGEVEDSMRRMEHFILEHTSPKRDKDCSSSCAGTGRFVMCSAPAKVILYLYDIWLLSAGCMVSLPLKSISSSRGGLKMSLTSLKSSWLVRGAQIH